MKGGSMGKKGRHNVRKHKKTPVVGQALGNKEKGGDKK